MIRIVNLIIILLLIWFLNDSFQDKQVEKVDVKAFLGTENTPDYFAENLQLRQFNEDGELQSLLKTKRLSHYPEQQHASLDTPELVLYAVMGDVTEITSQSGKLDDASRNLTLKGDVLLQISSDINNRQKTIIKTAELQYRVAEQLLWTTSPINGDFAQGKFAAKGLQMDLKSNMLLLEDKVKIHYDL